MKFSEAKQLHIPRPTTLINLGKHVLLGSKTKLVMMTAARDVLILQELKEVTFAGFDELSSRTTRLGIVCRATTPNHQTPGR
jgi:hypothetical protein